MKEQTLSIDDWSSTCLACGGGANPEEKCHDSAVGYGAKHGQRGCGVEWKYLGSQYGNTVSIEMAKEMRPDLIWIDIYSLK